MNKKPILKIGIIFFVIFCFKNFTLKAGDIKYTVAFNSAFKNNTLESLDKIVISGTIKDEHGVPLEKVKVIFDSTEVAVSDKGGTFSFELNTVSASSHNIYFSYNGFITVRSYYPVMLSANYNVILYQQVNKRKEIVNDTPHIVISDTVHLIKKEIADTTSKIPIYIQTNLPIDTVSKAIAQPIKTIPPVVIKKEIADTVNTIPSAPAIAATDVELDFPSILFKMNLTALSRDNKGFLDIIVKKLKENPAVKIDIRAYTPEHDNNPSITQNRLLNIIKYLKAKGIDADRMKKVIITSGGDENTIDLIKSN